MSLSACFVMFCYVSFSLSFFSFFLLLIIISSFFFSSLFVFVFFFSFSSCFPFGFYFSFSCFYLFLLVSFFFSLSSLFLSFLFFLSFFSLFFFSLSSFSVLFYFLSSCLSSLSFSLSVSLSTSVGSLSLPSLSLCSVSLSLSVSVSHFLSLSLFSLFFSLSFFAFSRSLSLSLSVGSLWPPLKSAFVSLGSWESWDAGNAQKKTGTPINEGAPNRTIPVYLHISVYIHTYAVELKICPKIACFCVENLSKIAFFLGVFVFPEFLLSAGRITFSKKTKITIFCVKNMSNYVAQHNWTDSRLNLGQLFHSTILLIFCLFSFLKKCRSHNFYSVFSENTVL